MQYFNYICDHYNYYEQIKYYIKLTKAFIAKKYYNNLYILIPLRKVLIMIKVIARCRSPGLLLTE